MTLRDAEWNFCETELTTGKCVVVDPPVDIRGLNYRHGLPPWQWVSGYWTTRDRMRQEFQKHRSTDVRIDGDQVSRLDSMTNSAHS